MKLFSSSNSCLFYSTIHNKRLRSVQGSQQLLGYLGILHTYSQNFLKAKSNESFLLDFYDYELQAPLILRFSWQSKHTIVYRQVKQQQAHYRGQVHKIQLLPTIHTCSFWGLSKVYYYQIMVVMGPSLGSAWPWARLGPGLGLFWRARHFEKGPDLIQTRARLFEKGPENWSFYGVKIRGSSRLGPDFFRKA